MAERIRNNHVGVTPPISLLGPTQAELDATRALLTHLHTKGVFESEEDSNRRQMIFARLNVIVQRFVHVVAEHRNLSQRALDTRAKLFSFGSYRMGVQGPGDDMDVLCVVPRHVQRKDFFGTLYRMLEAEKNVEKIVGVPHAVVPIIKITYDGIPVDIAFSRLGLKHIPEDFTLDDDDLLSQTDDVSSRSLNGTRDAHALLRLIPTHATFTLTLRTIKLWAKLRGLYGKPVGFFNGIAWTIIVARVCQLYPNAAPAIVVGKLFEYCANHPWPEPILLKDVGRARLNSRVDQPDTSDRMPIFTPAFPSNCVTHTVTRSTQIVLITEFEKAASIVNEILRGECMWSKLFEPYDFFHAYKYYIRIVASSGSADEQKEWSYKIESSIRHFISSIEFVKYVKYAHPFPVPFNGMRRCVNKQEMKTAQLEGVIESEDNDEDIDDEDDDWKKTVYTTAFWIGVAVEKKSASSTSSGQQRMLDLSWPTTDFINMVKAWDDFDEESMTVNVSYIRSRDIPLEVVDQAAWPKAQRREARGRQQKEDVEDEEEEEYEREEEEDEQDEQNEHNLAFANPTIGDVKTADLLGLESLHIGN